MPEGMLLAADMRLRRLRLDDRNALLDLLRGTGHFTAEEVSVAEELILDAANDPTGSGYWGTVAVDDDDRPMGYAVYGPTPMTDAAYDLYWIATGVQYRGMGVGKKLLQEVETDVQRRGGRVIRIETSAKEAYGGTRKFYEGLSYRVVGHIPNFYRSGDDLMLFSKELDRAALSDAPPVELRLLRQ